MRSQRLPEQMIYIRNLSSRGIGGRTRGIAPLEGEEVFLQLESRTLVGRVRWVRGDRFGIHLRDPIEGEIRAASSPWPRAEGSTGFQVADRFKPAEKAWRPGVTKIWSSQRPGQLPL